MVKHKYYLTPMEIWLFTKSESATWTFLFRFVFLSSTGHSKALCMCIILLSVKWFLPTDSTHHFFNKHFCFPISDRNCHGVFLTAFKDWRDGLKTRKIAPVVSVSVVIRNFIIDFCYRRWWIRHASRLA